ncbi:MAG: NADH-quinone oxidoreductase subunit N [Puniceicoccaceae bacterium]|nr:MAG: NADH-quinone oxidoreductase subunit N [Puniceicoccaceae bacterium]
MDPETLQHLAATNQWSAIYPELFLGLLAIGLLLAELVLPSSMHRLIPRAAIWAQVLLFFWILLVDFNNAFVGTVTFGGMLAHSPLGQGLRLFFLLTSILVSWLALIVLERRGYPRVEFFHIQLVVTGAFMLLAQSSHFAMLFVSLETATIGLYVLVAYFRDRPLSLEAGLKYLIFGGLSAAVLLFGIVLLYGAAGNPALPGYSSSPLHFPLLEVFLLENPDNLMARAGVLLVLAAVAFKIGAVPFQIWIPDVYQGAPTPVTALLAVASKAAGFAILLVLVTTVFSPLAGVLIPVLTTLTLLTLLFGNLAALTQRNTKRLMGLSGVSHAGFLLLGVTAALIVPGATGAVLFYLVAYLLASMAVFGVMAHLGGDDDALQTLDDYRDLNRRSPLLAGVLAVGLGSLAGIPPLAGFIGKLMIFIVAFEARLYLLLAVAMIAVVLSIYYYFGWIKAAFFSAWLSEEDKQENSGIAVTLASAATLIGLAAVTVLLGFIQGPLGRWVAGL